jgi:hypothetical protein
LQTPKQIHDIFVTATGAIVLYISPKAEAQSAAGGRQEVVHNWDAITIHAKKNMSHLDVLHADLKV